jgi:hypothetical protein
MLSSLQFGTDLSANRIMRTRHLGAVPNVRYWHKADIQVSPANVRGVKRTSRRHAAMSTFDPKLILFTCVRVGVLV